MALEKINFCCDVMWLDKKVGRLEITDSKLVKNEVYTNNIFEHPFPRSKRLMDIIHILSERVICKERWNDIMQRKSGIYEYNVYDILHNTHGADVDDFTWFRFDGECITWAEVDPRRRK